jgi:hypothetical protein
MHDMELLTIESKEEEMAFLNLLNNKGNFLYENTSLTSVTRVLTALIKSDLLKISSTSKQKTFGLLELIWVAKATSFISRREKQ